jgi:hypothetical protein
MVARIIKGKDIAGLIKYNEKEKSSVLYSQYINDAKDPDELTLKDKIGALQAYIRLNPAIAKPTFHVSLNPDPLDQLGDDQLQAIGQEYMAGMHYGQQPYLIYKHEDIDRVHIHIVSVTIGLAGRVINSSKERYRSETIRKELEIKYRLVKAGDKGRKDRQVPEPIDVAAITYGKTNTKAAISRVVRYAACDYTFASLAEFRSLLNYYHVTVDEVKDARDATKTTGLCYGVINKKGEKVSTRIKASAIGAAARYEALLQKFAEGSAAREARSLVAGLQEKVAAVLQSHPGLTQQAFTDHLSKQGVQVMCRPGKGPQLSGITFIDTRARTVVNGAALEPAFPAPALQALFA